jgi:hypothetical protein
MAKWDLRMEDFVSGICNITISIDLPVVPDGYLSDWKLETLIDKKAHYLL